jgi:hypothetical protein
MVRALSLYLSDDNSVTLHNRVAAGLEMCKAGCCLILGGAVTGSPVQLFGHSTGALMRLEFIF